MVCERQAEIDAFVPGGVLDRRRTLRRRQLRRSSRPGCTRSRARRRRSTNGEQAATIEKDLLAGEFKVAADRAQGVEAAALAAVHHQPPAAGGGAQVRLLGQAHDGHRPGPLRRAEIGDRGQIGLITYMRTDSTRVAAEAIDAVRETIAATYGADKLPAKPNVYASKKGAQDAHEAIRPTYLDLPPEAARALPRARRAQALSADLGALRRQPDAAGGLRRHPGRHRERQLHPARRGQGDEERRLPRRLPGGEGRGR